MRLLNKFLYGLWYSCDRYFRLIGLLYVNLRKKIPARKSGGGMGHPVPSPSPRCYVPAYTCITLL